METLHFRGCEANRLSFPDCTITGFICANNQIAFKSDLIFIEGRGLIAPKSQVDCVITGTVQLHEYVDEKWVNVISNQSTGLRDICELAANQDDLKLAGFQLASGMWNEYKVRDFFIKIAIPSGR